MALPAAILSLLLASPAVATDCVDVARRAAQAAYDALEGERLRAIAGRIGQGDPAERRRLDELQARFFADAVLLSPQGPPRSCAGLREAALRACIAAALDAGYSGLGAPSEAMIAAYRESRAVLHRLAGGAGETPLNGPGSSDPFDVVLDYRRDPQGFPLRVLEIRALLSEPDPGPRVRWYVFNPGRLGNPGGLQSFEFIGDSIRTTFYHGQRSCHASLLDFAAIALAGPACAQAPARREALSRLRCY